MNNAKLEDVKNLWEGLTTRATAPSNTVPFENTSVADLLEAETFAVEDEEAMLEDAADALSDPDTNPFINEDGSIVGIKEFAESLPGDLKLGEIVTLYQNAVKASATAYPDPSAYLAKFGPLDAASLAEALGVNKLGKLSEMFS